MAQCFYAQRTDPSRLNRMRRKRPNPKYDRVRATFELITQRQSLIRALYIVSVVSNGPVDAVHKEFHQAVGDILEGMALSKLNLTYIDRNKVREEAAWLRDRS